MIGKIGFGLLTFAVAFASCVPVALATDKEELEQARTSVKCGRCDEAFVRLHALAERGHPTAQCLVGMMYQKGKGVTKDSHQAALWYKKSAQKGFADAQNRLGHMYLNGDEIKKDSLQAEHWLSKAAKQGVAEAQLHLGKIYLGNKGVSLGDLSSKTLHSKRMLEGRRLILLARDQGVDEAQRILDEIPGYEKTKVAIETKTQQATHNYSQGLGNVEESWEGYADLIKSMDSADAAAASQR